MKAEERLDALRRAVELERQEEQRRFRERQATLSRKERIHRGVAADHLEPVDESWGYGGRHVVTYEGPVSNAFTQGSVLELRPLRDEEPRASATVVRRREQELSLAFDRRPPPFTTEGRSFIELAPDDITYARNVASLEAVRAWTSGTERRRRDAWFGEDSPRSQPAPDTETGPLNPEQYEALTRARGARDFFVVHGPPGTGKSTVLAALIAAEVRSGVTILATAASNSAVDHLLELALAAGLKAVRIGHPARVAENLRRHTLDELLAEHPEREVLDSMRDEAADLLGYSRRQRKQGRSQDRKGRAADARRDARQLFRDASDRERLLARSILDDADVVAATLSAAAGRLLSERTFGLAVLDEATQATEPAALAAFLRSQRVVLAGDHQQLPPTVISREAQEGGLGISALERLVNTHPDHVTLLREQYRMNAAIMAFPSDAMYGGELRAHESVADRTLDVSVEDAAVPFLFVDTAGKGFEETEEEDSESLANEGEAELVLQHLRRLVNAGVPADEIAVITPYAGQARLFRQRLNGEVDANTIDAFQGREKDVVLVSLVRSNEGGEVGFLRDTRRMNVALTRARRHAVIVGDSATLASHPFYARMIEHSQATNAYRSAWAWGP
ncbi:MAG: AAA domain-containing protein [Myxococcota bacterium]